MSVRKRWLRGVLAAVSVASMTHEARAQCGAGLSECRQCHEIRGARPVQAGPLPWHRDHAFADLCAACHGGDPQAFDEGAAHSGMTNPLADVRATCGACHDGLAGGLAERYVRIASPSLATPTATPSSPVRAETGRRVAWPNVVLAATILVFGACGAVYVLHNERSLRARDEGGET